MASDVLTDEVLELCRSGATCYLATTMPDGSPQLTQTWVDTDGEHVLVNTVVGYQKARNIERDPRVALTVSDPSNPSRYHQLRGRVVRTTTEGAADHIEMLSQRYTGGPYPWYGGRDQQRLLLVVEAEHRHSMG
ncbi:PPOX class F420-dependent oxidoreductase [Nocardioides lentus]|uniref:PPOX class F420-dependent oxidoreductase n=1 Tax=Nocardioides lentus TaxID=338077 RepID=A0ABP5AEC4_9ACTN